MLKLLTTLENLFMRYVPWHSEQELRDALKTIEELRNEITGNVPAGAVAESNADTPNATPETPAGVTENPTIAGASTETIPAVSTVAAAVDSTTPVPSVSESTTPDANASDAVTPVMPLEPETNAPAENAGPVAETVAAIPEKTTVPDVVIADSPHIPEPEYIPFPGSYTPPPAS